MIDLISQLGGSFRPLDGESFSKPKVVEESQVDNKFPSPRRGIIF